MDGTEEPRSADLRYPFAAPPEPDKPLQVADGVLWVRMPLPFSLAWINLWLIEDGEGYALVDTGLGIEPSREIWRAVFARLARPITRVLCTHMHPDHVGLAGWVTRKFDCALWMSRLEYMTCRVLVADTGRTAPEDGVRFYRAAGWDEPALERYRDRFGLFGQAVSRLPESFVRLSDGQSIRIGEGDWRVVSGCGHSPEHACLFREADGVLISGDQVLPRISSNVSVFPTEPEANPLGDWLDSCRKLKSELPSDALVLPSHNEPFYGLHSRLEALLRGHERSLDRLEARLSEPQRALDVFAALFARGIEGDMLGMATGEAIAHLNLLRVRGRATRTVTPEGVALYRRA